MNERLIEIREAAIKAMMDVTGLKTLDELRVTFLGKKSELALAMKEMAKLTPEERPIFGQLVNEIRTNIEEKINEAKARLSQSELNSQIENETLDVTMPGKKRGLGHKHPMTYVIEEIKEIFLGMGYSVAEGPEIETDYYNFEALNIPAHHPAKDEQDTLYINEKFLLRTQTSSVQVRTMEKTKPPIKIIAPGKVFRSDDVDATHSPVFHQCEGLVVDEGITMGNLFAALDAVAKKLLNENVKTRFRPSFFPFTEPSAEMDVTCHVCGGKGCRVCKGSGWIELLGCGMVHPNVLKMAGIDPEKYSGFAFGMGLERIALMRYGISDMRLLFENDVRFLRQF